MELEKLNKILEKYKLDKAPIMPVLQNIQKEFGFISRDSLISVSDFYDVPLQELYGIVTFYSQFKLVPSGKYEISLCMGTACYVKGAEGILNEITSVLGITDGECTEDGMFSLNNTRCLGCCALAPVLMINDNVYGNVKKEEVKGILEKYM